MSFSPARTDLALKLLSIVAAGTTLPVLRKAAWTIIICDKICTVVSEALPVTEGQVEGNDETQ
jgi:hypothetical protein